MSSSSHGLVFVVLLLGTGCATSGSSLFPGDAAHEKVARQTVRQRAAFDLGCEQFELVSLAPVGRLGGQMTSHAIGATGCGKKASYYVECVSNWGDISCTPRIDSKE